MIYRHTIIKILYKLYTNYFVIDTFKFLFKQLKNTYFVSFILLCIIIYYITFITIIILLNFYIQGYL